MGCSLMELCRQKLLVLTVTGYLCDGVCNQHLADRCPCFCLRAALERKLVCVGVCVCARHSSDTQDEEVADMAEGNVYGTAPSQVSGPTPTRPSEPPVTSPHRQLPGAASHPQAEPRDAAAPSGNREAKENEVNNFTR